MAADSIIKTGKHQQGIALLVLVIAIILAFTAYALSGLSINQVKIEQKNQTRVVLKKAKQALIAHAITRSDRAGDEGEMGYLPCPDWFDGAIAEGGSDGSCGTAKYNASGYYPWVSLETDILHDGSGSCLWYVLSSAYKTSGYSGMINEDSEGTLELVDAAGAKAVALVVAPGEPLTGQSRTFDNTSLCGKFYSNLSQHLEGDGVTNNGVLAGTVDAIDQFIHASAISESAATPYNDQFIAVTRDEIWKSILNRSDFTEKMENLTQALAMCMASYANLAANTSRRLLWPVKTDLNGADYRDNANYKDEDGTTIGYSGRFPFDVTNSNNAIWPTNPKPDGIVNDIFEITDPDIYQPLPPLSPTMCENLDLSGTGAGPFIDLNSSDSEYRRLWNNWKDHFFYLLSKPYEPSNAGQSQCGAADCIKINSGAAKYAGAVIFSGKRLLDAGGNDTLRSDKSVVADYLEDAKAAVFTDEVTNKTGSEDYNYTNPQTDAINDIMYCIKDHPIVDDVSTPTIDETVITVAECS